VSRPAYRLLALDLDGTLLNSAKTVSARTIAALSAARAAGVHLVVVTGRRYPAALRATSGLGMRTPFILHNGALIVEDGQVLRCRPLDVEVARLAVRLGQQAGADPVVHRGVRGEGRLQVEAVSPANPLLNYYLDRSRPDVDVVADLEARIDADTIQVMFGGAMTEMSALFEALVAGLAERANVERTGYPGHGVTILDVVHPAVGKAEALSFLRGRLGLTAAETVAIGDNWNDRRMLTEAGLGLLMGNADPELHALGLPALPTNDEDGVAVAIERYVLGTPAS
jgi:Cof subfamily protein (haloacid dehalogenase superfamily)